VVSNRMPTVTGTVVVAKDTGAHMGFHTQSVRGVGGVDFARTLTLDPRRLRMIQHQALGPAIAEMSLMFIMVFLRSVRWMRLKTRVAAPLRMAPLLRVRRLLLKLLTVPRVILLPKSEK
jgi:hypothetical protein